MAEKKHPNVTWLYIMGILTVLMGMISVSSPLIAGTAVVYIVGAVMLIAGIAQIASGMQAEGLSHKLMPLVLGIVTVLGGISALLHPILGLTILTFFLAAYFLAEGVWKIIAAFSYRPATGWLAMLLSGVITWVLGAMILTQWPYSGLWAIGVLVGVNLIFTGFALISVAATVGQILDKVEDKISEAASSDKAAHA
ncbi:HdeD family acid-resistance protein [Bremerella cremea]|uniref:HdeD family acid-resistance protein n=1 Tax=Bremerella cremea TaxID=1031537 RepID=UPI0031F11FF1